MVLQHRPSEHVPLPSKASYVAWARLMTTRKRNTIAFVIGVLLLAGIAYLFVIEQAQLDSLLAFVLLVLLIPALQSERFARLFSSFCPNCGAVLEASGMVGMRAPSRCGSCGLRIVGPKQTNSMS